MAAFNNEIVIKIEVRPCLYGTAEKNKPALFHKWVEETYIVPPSPMVGGHKGGEIKETRALIELENGHMMKAKASEIKFVDNKFQEYIFEQER